MSQPTFIIRDPAIRERAVAFLNQLDLSKPWQLVVTPFKRNRSLQQNNLYWGWIGMIAQETGNGNEDIHEWLKRRFLAPSFVTVGNETQEIRRSTTKLNTKEMSEYMAQVEAWAASELGIVLPRPEDAR
jgi:hypothetical protein